MHVSLEIRPAITVDDISMIFLADLESNLDDLFQIECDAANAMMKIRFGPTPTRFCTQKGASCDPKKVG